MTYPHNLIANMEEELQTLRERIKELTTWIPCSEKLPRIETPVLIRFYNGTTRIGELRQEHPTWEETFRPYNYWDDPDNDGQDWDWMDITHWMNLPRLPEEIKNDPRN